MKKRKENKETKEAMATATEEEIKQVTQAEAEKEPEQATMEQSNAGENNQKEEPGFGKVDYDYTTNQNNPDLAVKPVDLSGDEPKTIKCPHCGEEMPITISTCVNCGHYLKENEKYHYKPIEESKIKKIRWIITVVCIVAFIIYMVVKSM